jgi:hypothetical protein
MEALPSRQSEMDVCLRLSLIGRGEFSPMAISDSRDKGDKSYVG